jgi:flagellar hook-length control protein FliK
VIPILDSLQMATPEKGPAGKIHRNEPDSSSEGVASRAFSDILSSHGASLAADADGVADQTSSVEGGNLLLSSGQTLPPADVSRDLLLPVAGQGSAATELLVPGDPVNAVGVAVGQPSAEAPGAEVILPDIKGVNEASRESHSAPLIIPAEAATQGIAPAAPTPDHSANVSQAAEVMLPVTSGLGDLAKKVVDRTSLSQGSPLEPHTVSPVASQPLKAEHVFPVEPRPSGDMNALPATANVTNPKGGVERAEAQVSQSVNASDLNQYRFFPGLQPSLLSPGQNLSAGQNLASGYSLASPVSDVGWGHEFVGRMNLMVKNGVQEMKLQLKPAELGLLEIKLSTEGDQAKVIFNVHNAAARDAIDSAMPRLRDMLEQSGLQLVHSEVNDNSSQQDQGNPSNNSAVLTADAGAENESAEGLQLEVAVRAADSLIDYYI